MRRYRLLFAPLLLAGTAYAQQPQLAPNAPKDRPVPFDTLQSARMDSLTVPLVARARQTYPAAKQRYLAGLPPGESFFLTTRLGDSLGNREQVFIAVDSIRGDRVYGRIWSEIGAVRGYRLKQPYNFPERDLVDWLIAKPDGTEEGNLLGKFLEEYQAQEQRRKLPSQAGGSPPSLHGLRLGDSRARLDSVMGKPTSTQALGTGVVALGYAETGMSVVFSEADGVSIIYADTREAGDLGGVRVGDAPGSVVQRWGAPARAEGRTALFDGGPWVIVIVVDSIGQRVVRIGVGRKG